MATYPKENIYPFGVTTPGRVQTRSETDYVKGGKVYRGGSSSAVMVTAQSDLANLEGYNPGTVAYTAGFGSMWQLAADGTWVSLEG